MQRNLILLVLIFFAPSLFSKSFVLKDFKENGVVYVWDRADLFDAALKVYLTAFDTLYSKLGVENRAAHFQATMKEELRLAHEHPMEVRWLCAIKDNKVVGVSMIELFAFPYSIYVREMAVLPEYQRQGIGRVLTFAPLKDLPETMKIAIVTRRINEGAIAFYKALGFNISDYSHLGYDPNKYVGMEWIKK